MKKCKRCGTLQSDDVRFCTGCGTSFDDEQGAYVETVNQKEPQEERYVPPSSRILNAPQFIWSLINIIAGLGGSALYFPFLMLMPFGAASMAFVIAAQSTKTAESEDKKLKIAKILNIIGVVSLIVHLLKIYFDGIIQKFI